MVVRRLHARLRRRGLQVMAAALAASSPFLASPALAADIIKGRQLYHAHCAQCHGSNGISFMPGAPSFARQERMLQPDAGIVAAIRSGRNAMPAYAGILTDRELFDVVAYMRTLR